MTLRIVGKQARRKRPDRARACLTPKIVSPQNCNSASQAKVYLGKNQGHGQRHQAWRSQNLAKLSEISDLCIMQHGRWVKMLKPVNQIAIGNNSDLMEASTKDKDDSLD